jgi:hypothetical protein
MSNLIVVSLIAIANAVNAVQRADRLDDGCPYQPGDGSAMFCTGSRAISANPGDVSHYCADLQTKRIAAFNQFYANSYQSFMESAKGFEVADLFDKSAKLVGNETYEQMLMQHVKCMSVPEASKIEDKIILKKTAQDAGVPVTDWYFGAHESDFSRSALEDALVKVCEAGVDAFIIKATHLAWSMGQKIVRGWQKTCMKAGLHDEIAVLANFIEGSVLALRNTDPDMQHLAESLKPGVIIEELFSTGGLSGVPLEAKTMVVWGKVFDIYMKGEDNRGCAISGGNWDVYGDGTGWNLNGMMNEKSDAASDFFMQNMFPKIKEYAETFAGQHLKADLARIDFFINTENGDVKLNEVETVSGNWYAIEHEELGAIWRNGYLINGGVDADVGKWSTRLKDVAALAWDIPVRGVRTPIYRKQLL